MPVFQQRSLIAVALLAASADAAGRKTGPNLRGNGRKTLATGGYSTYSGTVAQGGYSIGGYSNINYVVDNRAPGASPIQNNASFGQRSSAGNGKMAKASGGGGGGSGKRAKAGKNSPNVSPEEVPVMEDEPVADEPVADEAVEEEAVADGINKAEVGAADQGGWERPLGYTGPPPGGWPSEVVDEPNPWYGGGINLWTGNRGPGGVTVDSIETETEVIETEVIETETEAIETRVGGSFGDDDDLPINLSEYEYVDGSITEDNIESLTEEEQAAWREGAQGGFGWNADAQFDASARVEIPAGQQAQLTAEEEHAALSSLLSDLVEERMIPGQGVTGGKNNKEKEQVAVGYTTGDRTNKGEQEKADKETEATGYTEYQDDKSLEQEKTDKQKDDKSLEQEKTEKQKEDKNREQEKADIEMANAEVKEGKDDRENEMANAEVKEGKGDQEKADKERNEKGNNLVVPAPATSAPPMAENEAPPPDGWWANPPPAEEWGAPGATGIEALTRTGDAEPGSEVIGETGPPFGAPPAAETQPSEVTEDFLPVEFTISPVIDPSEEIQDPQVPSDVPSCGIRIDTECQTRNSTGYLVDCRDVTTTGGTAGDLVDVTWTYSLSNTCESSARTVARQHLDSCALCLGAGLQCEKELNFFKATADNCAVNPEGQGLQLPPSCTITETVVEKIQVGSVEQGRCMYTKDVSLRAVGDGSSEPFSNKFSFVAPVPHVDESELPTPGTTTEPNQ
jgi:hypothetical protein